MIRQLPADPGKPTRTSKAAAALKKAILSCELEPGQKVNLDGVREEYGISLSTLREAVSRLIAERLVEFEDQRGYRITPVSAENLAEVTRLRADMEALALGYAIRNAGLDWESGIPSALHRLKRAPPDPGFPEHQVAHEAFHAALTEGCNMPLLNDFATMLRNLHLRYRNLLGYAEGGRDLGAEHAAVAEAAVARDAELAPTLLRRHIERSGAELGTIFAARKR